MKKNLISRRNFPLWTLIALAVLTAQSTAHAQFADSTFNNSDWTSAKINSLSTTGSTFTASQDSVAGNPPSSRRTTHTYPAGNIFVSHLSNSSTYDPASQGAIVNLSYSYQLRHVTTGAVGYYLLAFQNNTYYVHTPNDLATSTAWQAFGSSNLTAASFVNVTNQTSNEHPDFSCRGSRIVFGYVTRNHNPIANSSATTVSGIDNWRVRINETRRCCGEISEARVRCDRGAFVYTFTVTNNSTQAVQYLLLSPAVGATFNISPNIINFGTSPLNPGQSTNVSVTITNASSGDHVCINVALADKNIVTCCTIQTCVDLPECPCLRVVDTSITCGANGGYTYTVSFVNLTNVPIQQVFIVATQPSNLIVTPQLVTLSTPLQPNQQTTLTISISGAPPGTKVCLRLTPVGDNEATCCSIERCFTLPSLSC